jgi:hypothetical protein
MEQELINAYKWQRERSNNAKLHQRRSAVAAWSALKQARLDVLSKTSRYPGNQQFKRNKPFESGGYKLEWMEQPEHFGLRFVGYADEIATRNYGYGGGIDHTGWYTRHEDYYETLRGAVFQLPARNGRPVYVAGYVEMEGDKPINGNSAAICLSSIVYGEESHEKEHISYDEAARECARVADSIAKEVAETQREYDEAWQNGQRYSDLGEEVAEMRKHCLALIKEIKAQGKAFAPAICETLKAHVSSYVRDIQEAREKREKLKDAVYNWQYAAFNEGAGEKVFSL